MPNLRKMSLVAAPVVLALAGAGLFVSAHAATPAASNSTPANQAAPAAPAPNENQDNGTEAPEAPDANESGPAPNGHAEPDGQNGNHEFNGVE